MNSGGIGIGSSSIVLVFAVLCLTVFALITLVVASNDKALSDAEARLVIGYYEADTLAELILADILELGTIPPVVRDISINSGWDEEADAEVAYFYCPITDTKALYVRLAFREGTFHILSWRMKDIDEWVFDDRLNVWLGDE